MRLLENLAPIRLTGPDARSFLQGQLSHDLTLLTTDQSLLACCNSAQGRVQAVTQLLEHEGDLFTIVPTAMIETIINRLRKYVLRAKLTIRDARDSVQIGWLNTEELSQHGITAPQRAGECSRTAKLTVLRWPDGHATRFVCLGTDLPIVAEPSAATAQAWQLADIRAGLPQVFPETYESFVAQMLNLDLLNGISFNKGCYTGQEIIARAHFRGTIKRRMFRFTAPGSAPAPGCRVLCNGAHAGEVVMATSTGKNCELLAVISLAHYQQPLQLEGQLAGQPAGQLDSAATPLQLATLPYELPLQN